MKKSNPPPVTISVLREHFRTTYKLDEAQVELMITSSKQSLDVTLSAAREALQHEKSCGDLARVSHNLKGLLMNMGEDGWAQLARNMEKAAKAGEEIDYAGIIDRLYAGVAEITEYSPPRCRTSRDTINNS